jgi:hypothetical protein
MVSMRPSTDKAKTIDKKVKDKEKPATDEILHPV